jgi:hypothetical protein
VSRPFADCRNADGTPKKAYWSRHAARQAERSLKLIGHRGLRAYPCPECGLYHVGRKSSEAA